ncbi:MAG: cardiolipin synthase [Methanobacteriota archaeon]
MIEELFRILFPFILIANVCFAITVVFFERKNPTATVAWLMALIFAPVIGFLLYIIVGQNFHRERMFRIKKEDDQKLLTLMESQKKELRSLETDPSDSLTRSYIRMVLMLIENNRSELTDDNQIRVFIDGNDKFAALLQAIKGARDHIHLEYYILKDDEIGNEVFAALSERARAGVEVRFLGDGLGCSGPKKQFFEEYLKSGGKLVFFFPSWWKALNPRVNYRNHRKIAVIDGKTGFVGGFNIGDDYLSRIPEWAPWRDTGVQVDGSAVRSMQMRFFLDWNYAAPDNQIEVESRYFPKIDLPHGRLVQLVSGGPDTPWNPIKESYLKLISNATDSVYIQTPYFIPDDSIMDALRIAALSGVDVRIMMPGKPDHPFVYWAGYSYLGQLLDSGLKAYTYDTGFIHAKTIVVDEVACSIGSANWDVRSFRLNFETNVITYSPDIAKELKNAFIKDLSYCTEMTPERYAALPLKIKLKQSISRLFSPLL